MAIKKGKEQEELEKLMKEFKLELFKASENHRLTTEEMSVANSSRQHSQQPSQHQSAGKKKAKKMCKTEQEFLRFQDQIEQLQLGHVIDFQKVISKYKAFKTKEQKKEQSRQFSFKNQVRRNTQN